MLRSLKGLVSYKVSATDADVGKIIDFLFDDQHWTTRYLVTDTSGFWEASNQVLISPMSFRQLDCEARQIQLWLEQSKVKSCPSVDLAKPVSRQYERDYSRYYGWPCYWGLRGVWGMAAVPQALVNSKFKDESPKPVEESHPDPHLRSAKEVIGYHIHGSDGEIGHITDFIVDDETWTIRYLVIDTSNWWIGKKVLVPPYWASKISWPQNLVYLVLTKEAIRRSPEWNQETPVHREYEERLYDYYSEHGYWSRGDDR